ncbi:MAG TPA: cytochrome c [Pyrinomonadaceae bacterium]|nr:cytochrome c [Pyrinomonadaceae bacterium]
MRVELRKFSMQVATTLLVCLCISAWLGAAFSLTVRQNSQRVVDSDDLFLKNCASCHGRDGRAKTFKAKFNHARNLTDSKWQTAISDEHMYESILRGNGKMPAFDKKLSKTEIGALVTYVRQLKK